MSDEDNIFREVDEEMRREKLAALWDKFGVFVLGGAALIVVVVGGYNFNEWWTAKRAADDGHAYYEATRLLEEKNETEALAVLDELIKDGGQGYSALAQLRIASLRLKDGKNEEAVALYDKVAKGGGDPVLRDFAALQAAALRLDKAGFPEMRKRLEGLNKDKNAWRYSAQELLALSAFRSGNVSESEKLFSQILSDPSAPAEIRRRAEAMLAMLIKAPERVSSAATGGEESRTQ